MKIIYLTVFHIGQNTEKSPCECPPVEAGGKKLARREVIIIIIMIIIKLKKEICKIVDFAVPADHRIKLKECEKRDKYLDLARELKKIYGI